MEIALAFAQDQGRGAREWFNGFTVRNPTAEALQKREANRRYVIRHRERVRAAKRDWYARNREVQIARVKRWVQQNPERRRAIKDRWLAKQRAATQARRAAARR